MRCDKHPQAEMEVVFKGGFGGERKVSCPECEKEERKRSGQSRIIFSSGDGWSRQ
ncbi:MAG: hypothetical protein Q8O93_02370 [bacterium]|nr:hypothetical protein [bacterium]